MKVILRRILVTTILVLLTVSSILILNVKAGMLIPYPIEPNNDPPIIEIENPTNKTYNTQNLTLTFTITKPDTWTWSEHPAGLNFDFIRKIRYFLDDKEEILYNNTRVSGDIFPKVQYHSIELTNLTEGSHVLRIEVFIEQLYKSASDPDTYLYTPHSINSKTTTSNPVIFNITTNTPTPTATPTPSPSEQEPFPSTLVLTSIAIIAVFGLGIFAYYKKRRN